MAKSKWKRTLRRHTLNILVAALALVALVCVVVAGWYILSLFRDSTPTEPDQTLAETPVVEPQTDPTEPDPVQPEATDPVPPEPATPDEPDASDEPDQTPEAEDDTAQHVFGGVRLTYEPGALVSTDTASDMVSLTTPDGAELPRLDLQGITGQLDELTAAQRQTLAVGVLQSYYVDGPASEQVTVAADDSLTNAYRLSAPATDDAPAVTARVRFFQSGAEIWIVSLLESTESAGDPLFEAVFASAEGVTE